MEGIHIFMEGNPIVHALTPLPQARRDARGAKGKAATRGKGVVVPSATAGTKRSVDVAPRASNTEA